MFGKRGEMPISVAGGEMPLRAPGFVGAALKPAAARAIAIPEIVVAPRGAPVPAAAASAPGNGSNGSRDAAKPQAAINSRRSDNYYDIKSTIFNAVAGKVSGDLLEIIKERPTLVAELLRSIRRTSARRVSEIVRQVRDGDW